MPSSQASRFRLLSDPFSVLPPEINIQILEYLSLHDVKSAIASSPALLKTWRIIRQCILRPHIDELQLSYGDISSFQLAAAAMHLRELHSEHDGDTIPVLEKKVEPVLDSILLLNAKTTKVTAIINLSMVTAAQELLPEITGAFMVEGSGAFMLEGPFDDEEAAEFRYRSPGSLWPDKAPLGIRRAFSDSFLRFDCYRNIFQYKDQELFKKRPGIKDAFLDSFPAFPKFDDNILRMYPYLILGKLRHRFCNLMADAEWTIRDSEKIVWSKGAWKEVLVAKARINFRNCTRTEEEYFEHRLVFQGYPKLAFWEQLSQETLASTVQEEFQELVVSNLQAPEAWAADESHRNKLYRHFTLWRN